MIRRNKPPPEKGKSGGLFPREKNPELAHRRHNPEEPPPWRKPGSGRPTEYRPWMCEKIVEMMSEGKTVLQCCAELDISNRTFYNWTIEIPEFKEAYERALPKLEAWWLNEYQNSLRTTKDTKVHQALLILATKNIVGWADKMEQKITKEHQAVVCVKVDWGLASIEEIKVLRELPREIRKKITLLMKYDRATINQRKKMVKEAEQRREDHKILLPEPEPKPWKETAREIEEELERKRREKETRKEEEREKSLPEIVVDAEEKEEKEKPPERKPPARRRRPRLDFPGDKGITGTLT